MPLTPAQINLLYEIYETPQIDTAIMSYGMGVTVPPIYIGAYTTMKAQLQRGINFIDQDASRVARVGEILEEYKGLSLDQSPIDRDGYSFNAQRNLKAIRKALTPLTGIYWTGSVGQINVTPWG